MSKKKLEQPVIDPTPPATEARSGVSVMLAVFGLPLIAIASIALLKWLLGFVGL